MKRFASFAATISTVVIVALALHIANRMDDHSPDAGKMVPMHAEAPRSGKWPKVERDFLVLHPVCEVCGHKGTADNPLNIHHVRPFHEHPELELDPANLITLCRRHHFLFGHLENWSSWNTEVREDAAAWRKKLEGRP